MIWFIQYLVSLVVGVDAAEAAMRREEQTLLTPISNARSALQIHRANLALSRARFLEDSSEETKTNWEVDLLMLEHAEAELHWRVKRYYDNARLRGRAAGAI